MDPLREALARAAPQGRVVVVEFSSPSSGPCLMLERATWPDPAVKAWLEEKAVFLNVDGPRHPDLVLGHRIGNFPTILLLRADGSELDRLVGYRAPHEFLGDAQSALDGRDTLTRAREAVAQDLDAVEKRIALADVLADKGLSVEALIEYLWCYDEGVEHDPRFANLRLAMLAPRIAGLGKVHPPALEALRQRRDSADRSHLNNPHDEVAARESVELSASLGEDSRLLQTYDRLPVGHLRRSLFSQARGALLAEKRYAEVLAAGEDTQERLDKALVDYLRAAAARTSDSGELDYLRGKASAIAVRLFEVFLGFGRAEEARTAASRVFGINPSGAAYAAFLEAATRAGDAAVLGELRARAENALPALPPDEQALLTKALTPGS